LWLDVEKGRGITLQRATLGQGSCGLMLERKEIQHSFTLMQV